MTHGHATIEREAALWLARRDAGGWGAKQQAALDAWLAEDIAHRVAFLRLDATWEATSRLQALAAGTGRDTMPARNAWQDSPYFAPLFAEANAGTATSRPIHRSHATTRARRWPGLVAAAACLLAIALVAGGLWWRDATHVDRGAWRTTIGAQQVVHLVDGSTATLGSNSELRVAFSRQQRDLYLSSGEAFFDVTHDRTRPFVVHVGGYRVIAVGTRFDVRREPAGIRVVVTRGLVRLQSAENPRLAATELPAGSVALVRSGQVSLQHVPLDEAQELLTWREGYVVFHGTPLAEAVREFNRYNSGKIVIADPTLDNLRVGGNFKLDNRAAFVRLVQEIFPVRTHVHDEDIVLSRRTAKQHR